jgi:hypothetical protein
MEMDIDGYLVLRAAEVLDQVYCTLSVYNAAVIVRDPCMASALLEHLLLRDFPAVWITGQSRDSLTTASGRLFVVDAQTFLRGLEEGLLEGLPPTVTHLFCVTPRERACIEEAWLMARPNRFQALVTLVYEDGL